MIKAAESFDNNLRALMKASGMKPADLARATGMSPQQLNGYLNEGRAPSMDVLDRFATAFGVSVADLFKSDQPPMPRVDSREKIFAELKSFLARIEPQVTATPTPYEKALQQMAYGELPATHQLTESGTELKGLATAILARFPTLDEKQIAEAIGDLELRFEGRKSSSQPVRKEKRNG